MSRPSDSISLRAARISSRITPGVLIAQKLAPRRAYTVGSFARLYASAAG